MIKHPGQRVGIFVDVANMYHSAKKLHGKRVNFPALLKSAVNNRILVRAIAYVIKSQAPDEEVFFEALDKSGFEVRTKELQVFSSGMMKADWDVGMCMDAVRMADKLDVVVLVTGDGDFVPLVTYLHEARGVLVEVIAFGETTAAKLLEAADDFTDLSHEQEHFLITPKRGHR